MSKKKASGGTTMTLKDFHGGSIPSDLPLPSAPGVTMRPMDRPGFDRQGPWGNPMGRSDHRLRPGSAGAVRNVDDKTPFLSPNVHIGRNFDEDERKPLDGAPVPRRTVSDDSIRALPMHTNLKPDYSSAFRPPSQQVVSATTPFSGSSPSSYAGRVSEASHGGGGYRNTVGSSSADAGLNSSKFGGNGGTTAPVSYPNAWAIRKEEGSLTEPLPATWSGPDAASKLAHASALEKVSSGRWQSKQPAHHPANIEPMSHSKLESEFSSRGDNFCNKSSYLPEDVPGSIEYQDAMLGWHAERSLTINDGVQGGGMEFPASERERLYPHKVVDNSRSFGGQPIYADAKFDAPGLPSIVPPGQSERPKLRLLPRSKPLDSPEPLLDHNQEFHEPQNYDNLNKATESYEVGNPAKTGFTVSDSGSVSVERPKLSLKPRSQTAEQEETIEKGRNTVFGGARPRELVLKERGIDDIVVSNHDVVQSPNRVKQDFPRTETVLPHVMPSRYNGKANGAPLDNRVRKNNEKRDNRTDVERTDMQKRNWRSDNQRNLRETVKHHHSQPLQERPLSPESWRKPLEEPRAASLDGPGLRFRKAASAVELAQAFSKSVSDPKMVDHLPSQRSVSRPGQIPFSRLMDPTSRPQINGY